MPINASILKQKPVGNHAGHSVRGAVKPPKQLGVHGTNVAVDFDSCSACGTCLQVCPMGVFSWTPSKGNPKSDRKSDPAKEKDCIACRACEVSCPQKAILITQK
jgi:NAD-dependent dihydropyrimidine dehydrogenase PreA subunit